MLPIAAHYVRCTTEERIRSALSTAPVRRATTASAGRTASLPVRDRLAARLSRRAGAVQRV